MELSLLFKFQKIFESEFLVKSLTCLFMAFLAKNLEITK